MLYNGGMSRGESIKKLNRELVSLNTDLAKKHFRHIIYLEVIEPRSSSQSDAVIHFYYLDNARMREYEICRADSADFYHGFMGLMDRYTFADFFRNYRFRTNDCSYRILIRKGVVLDANSDLGGFVYQNNGNSHLISPRERDVFERLSGSLLNYTDGVAQLVRVGCLLKNQKFRSIHNDYFGKVGIATLSDGATIRARYADSIANMNIITDGELFDEYIDLVNAIPMSEFTEQSVVSQLAKNDYDTKIILQDNYSNFLFVDDDEMDFAAILLDLFLRRMKQSFSLGDWLSCIDDMKRTSVGAPPPEREHERTLSLYRASYVLKRVQLPKLVHFIYDFFDFSHLSHNVGAFFPKLNELIGEDIREKYSHLETINVSLNSFIESQKPEEYFAEPKLINFSTAADREIQKQLLCGGLGHVFSAYYLCNYVQVADYKKYTDILPAAVELIKNLQVENEDDYGLFWMAGDLLNEFWRLLPDEDVDLQKEVESLVYDIYWPRIGSVWPIMHRNEVNYADEWQAQVFQESLGWIMCLGADKFYDRELKKYLASKKDTYDMLDAVDKKQYYMMFSKQKDHSLSKFLVKNSDDEQWYYAALDCDSVSDVEIFERMINADVALGISMSVREKVLHKLLSKTRSRKNFDELCSAWVVAFDNYATFLDHLTSDSEKAEGLAAEMLLEICGTVTDISEKKNITELSQKMREKYPTKTLDDKIKKALDLVDARIRLVKFQRKGVTADFIRSLH